tara:strand:+ start:59 stop:409 length:351 start_codon:yes stop_codon:yes gene_type:complete
MSVTIFAYLVTFIIVFFPINTLFIGLVGGILGRGVGMSLGVFMGALLLWNLIGVAWTKIEGGVAPIAVLIGAIGLLFLSVNDDLTKIAKNNIAAEQWAIIVFGGWLMYQSDVIRWI